MSPSDRKTKQSKEEDTHRGLKIVVIAMGIALIGGLILLFGLAFKKMTSPKPKPEPAISMSTKHHTCEPVEVEVTLGEKDKIVQDVEFEGK